MSVFLRGFTTFSHASQRFRSKCGQGIMLGMFPSPLPRPCVTPDLLIDLCLIGDVRGSDLLGQSFFQQRPNSINRARMNFQSLSLELHRVTKLTGSVRTSKVFYLHLFTQRRIDFCPIREQNGSLAKSVVTHDVVQDTALLNRLLAFHWPSTTANENAQPQRSSTKNSGQKTLLTYAPAYTKSRTGHKKVIL